MRKQLAATFEILIDHATVKSRGIDLEQHEIRLAMEPRICHHDQLPCIRAVNEALACESGRNVLASPPGLFDLHPSRDVVDHPSAPIRRRSV